MAVAEEEEEAVEEEHAPRPEHTSPLAPPVGHTALHESPAQPSAHSQRVAAAPLSKVHDPCPPHVPSELPDPGHGTEQSAP